MDVDGIEHLIMKGGKGVLSKVDSVLVEINDDFAEQAENCAALLTAAGLRLDSKKHAEGMELTSMKNSYNQIWSR